MWFTPGSSTCQPFTIIKIIFQTFINFLILNELENILGISVKIIFVSVILAIFINSLSFCCKKLILAFLARKTSSLLTKACKKELHSATGETSTDKHRPHQTILNWSKWRVSTPLSSSWRPAACGHDWIWWEIDEIISCRF